MLIHELVADYQTERNYSPDSINQLLDYYQSKYITNKIDLKRYQIIFNYLHKQGATSAHEYDLFEKSF